MKIQDQVIGEDQPVFIIAEAGINHNGDLCKAEELVRQAKRAGASAVKFQTYVTEKRVSKDNPVFSILKQCELGFKDQEKLAELARREGIIFFSTPFDEESVEFLASISVPVMKIASFDMVNLRLLRYVANKGIPMIVSRGMTNQSEVDRATKIMKDAAVSYALLHCVSSYPNLDENANLRVIRALKDRYHCPVGYSDHTLGIRVPVLSVAMGASIIEKHFTLDRNMEGPDHAISCDPGLLKDLVVQVRQTEQILGEAVIQMAEVEKGAVIFRRPSD